MFYVGAYLDENDSFEARTLVGWSKNKLAVQMYNVAGHRDGAFYDHYTIYEYDMNDMREFSSVIMEEWGNVVVDEYDDCFIDIYETIQQEYISLTNREYNELIVMSEPELEVMHEGIYNMIMCITEDLISLIRFDDVGLFIAWLQLRCSKMLANIANDPNKLSDKVDKVQAFLNIMKKTELSNFC